jgi:glycosyltransferase involved in cell wall biosynthesis
LPRTVIEGMAYECPVIATNVGGVGEMIRDGVDGALLPADVSVDALADVMLAYLRDPDRRAREGAAARASVLEGFSASAHGAQIYREIVTAMGR